METLMHASPFSFPESTILIQKHNFTHEGVLHVKHYKRFALLLYLVVAVFTALKLFIDGKLKLHYTDTVLFWGCATSIGNKSNGRFYKHKHMKLDHLLVSVFIFNRTPMVFRYGH